jgi:hypothetical protein
MSGSFRRSYSKIIKERIVSSDYIYTNNILAILNI